MHLGEEDYTTTIIINLYTFACGYNNEKSWVNIFIKFPFPNFRDNVHDFRFPCFFQYMQAAFMSLCNGRPLRRGVSTV